MKKPNILIINPDEMRADSLRHLGNRASYTPNIDALTKDGVSFSNAFCQNPVCVPSRCSFFTGLYPHVYGHRTMSFLQRPGEENLFSDFKNAGYYTVSSTRGDLMAGQYEKYHKELIDKYLVSDGSIHITKTTSPGRGSRESDTFFSFFDGICKAIDDKDKRVINGDDIIIDSAIREIKKPHADKPFFMFIGLLYPHPVYTIEKKYYDLIDKDKIDIIRPIKESDGKPMMERGLMKSLGISGWGEERLKELKAVYLAMCAKIDEQTGELIRALKESGEYDNTIIVFLSDHGDYTGDYGLAEKSQNCFPDCLTRVPLIIKPQKDFPVDSGITESLAELTDLEATLSELAEVNVERENFSESLSVVLQNRSASHREYVTCEGGRIKGEKQCMEYDPKTFNPDGRYSPKQELQSREDGTHTKAVMIRDKKYKYVRRLYEKDEFYDIARGESVNLIDDPKYAETVKDMKDKMLDWYMKTCDVVPKDYDERFPVEFYKNMLISGGKSPEEADRIIAEIQASGKGFSSLFIK